MRGRERIEQQCLQLKDMVEDHKRMELVDLQPTADEQQDILSLLRSIKAGVEALPHHTSKLVARRYDAVAKLVFELGYVEDVEEFKLKLKDPPPRVQPQRSQEHGGAGNQSSSTKSSTSPLQYAAPEPEPQSHSINTSSSSAADRHPGKKTVRFNDLLEQRYTDAPVNEGSSNAEVDGRSQTQFYSDNERLVEDQDRRLDEMSLSVNRQRELGISINSELDTHNELLNDLEMQADNSQSRLDRATHGVITFNRKARECGTCTIIMVLVLVLIVVIII